MKMTKVLLAASFIFAFVVPIQAKSNKYLENKQLSSVDSGVPDCKRTTDTQYYCKDCSTFWEYVPFTCDCQPSDEYTAHNVTSYPHITGSAHIDINDQVHIDAVLPKYATGVKVEASESGGWTVSWDFCFYV